MANAAAAGGVVAVKNASGQFSRLYVPVSVPAGVTLGNVTAAGDDVQEDAFNLTNGRCNGSFYYVKTENPPSENPKELAALLLPSTLYIIYEDDFETVEAYGAELIATLVETMKTVATWHITLPSERGIAQVLTVDENEITTSRH
jgi:hypothetical protein